MSMHRLLRLATVVLAVAPVQGQQVPPSWAAATAAFDAYARADSTVGGALVLVRGGRIVAEHYHGHANRAANVPANRQTIWHWGSITKTLTAVAFMQFDRIGGFHTDETRLLDQAVTRYVPELRRIHSDFEPIDVITFRMLLSHTSGLQNGTWPWTRGEAWEPFEPTEWAQLVAMMPYMRLRFAPGVQYGYSNPGIVYVARAMELLTGDPWQGRIYKTLFMPLGMSSSYFGVTPAHLQSRRSRNYSVASGGIRDHGAEFDPGITIPNGGWNASVEDLARWIGFLGGASDPARQAEYDAIVPRSTLEEMWQPLARVDAEEEMGLSFFLRNEDGNKLVGHTGTQANFRSFFWLNPATRTAVIGVVNTSSDVDGARSTAGFNEVMAAARRVLQ
jgi:CubicO group peptidase (beta-lactamase class C family)